MRLVASWPDCADTVQVGSAGWTAQLAWMEPCFSKPAPGAVPAVPGPGGPTSALQMPLLFTPQVSEVAGGPEALAPKLDKAAQLRFQGRSLAQALEAVERELA